MPPRIIWKAGPPAGAGKTDSAMVHACNEAAKGRWIIITQPSKALVEETYKGILAKQAGRNFLVDRFHSGLFPPNLKPKDRPSVTGLVRQYLRDAADDEEDQGRILLCTHAAFFLIDFDTIRRGSKWACILDEVPPVHASFTLDDPEFRNEIEQVIEYADSGLFSRASTEYRRVFLADDSKSEIEKRRRNLIADQLHDEEALGSRDPYRDFQIDVYAKLLSSWHEIFVKGSDVALGRAELTFYSLLAPGPTQRFRSFLVMSARLDDTALVHFWSKGDPRPYYVFRDAPYIMDRVRYREHANGHRLTLYYAAEGSWSKTRAGKKIDGKTQKEVIGQAVAKLFEGDEYVWMGNVDTPASIFGANAKAKRLPNTPHGLNNFQKYHNVAILSALNLTPEHQTFLTAAGFDQDAVKRAIYWSAAYQAIMRCSLRDLDATAPVRVVVPSSDMARWLAAEVFPGADVEALPSAKVIPSNGRAGRPKKDAHAKTRATADEKIRATLKEVDRLDQDPPTVLGLEGDTLPATTLGATEFIDIYDSGKGFYREFVDNESFIARLRKDWADNVVAGKKHAPLVARQST